MKKIEIEHLTFSYSTHPEARKILRDVCLQADGNESIGIIGANGVGKSTLLKILTGLLLDYTGSVMVGGISIEKKSLAAVRKQLGYVFQDSDSQLFMPTVYEDVAFAPRNYGYSRQETDERVMDALRMVHMEEHKDRQIYRLSGGEKKLVSIATILSMQPDILLLDEPSIALDPKNRRNLIRILNSLPGLKLIASHDLDMIWDCCERTVLLAEGTIVQDGRTQDILSNEALLEQNGLELPLSLYRRKIVNDDSE